MSVNDVLYINTKINSNYDNVIGKLTLFEEPFHNLENENECIKYVERPITPIEHEIKYAPASLDEFLSLFRRRIYIGQNDGLSEEDQLSLLGIIESEMRISWPQLGAILDYPFFDENQNKEMRRSLFITIIVKCKDSLDEFKKRIQFYKDKNVFSDEANLVRVKLQLAEDVKKKLHIPSLRRQMCENVSRGIFVKDPECCPVPFIVKLEDKFQSEVHDTSRRPTRESSLHPQSRLSAPSSHQEGTRKELFTPINEVVEKVDTTNSEVASATTVPTLCQQIINVEASKERCQFMKDDLHKLLDDFDEAEEVDSFPIMSEAMPNLDYYKSKNDRLQLKIDDLIERNKVIKQSESFVARPSLVEQPSSIARNFKNKEYLVGDIRPTPRRNDCDISLSVHGPLWNELADEITPEIVKTLDSNLFRGEEVKDIYMEMMKTVSHDHLSYTQDALFEKCPPKINVQEIMSSSTLSSQLKKERIINPFLKTVLESPWENEGKSRIEWESPNYNIMGSTVREVDLKHFVDLSRNSNSQQRYLAGGSYGGSLASAQNSSRDPKTLSLDNFKDPVSSNRDTPIKMIAKREYVISSEKFAKGLTKIPRLMQDRLVKQYEEWLTSWKNNFDSDDYMKFLSLQATDFLSVIFHQYESNNSEIDEIDDVYVAPEILEQRHKMKEREMERNTIVEQRVLELELEKQKFIPGFWNLSTIFVGGLGKTPIISDQEIQEMLRDKPQLEDPDERLSKMSAYSRARSAVYNSKPVPLFTNKGSAKEDPTKKDEDVNKRISIIQNRLDKIWSHLKMPNHFRLDMTIKYSSGMLFRCIDTVLHQWELATNLVVERETALFELERFERIASDPNRFFVKGYRGSSMARLEESRIRADLQDILAEVTIKTQNAIDDLRIICGDELTYGGRIYVDKMKWDQTEMLYWLQEERKELCTKMLNTDVSIK